MRRTPEPELMDAPAQASAYAEADFSESNQAFVDQFVALADGHERRSPAVIDLGCGPGDICIRIAQALPDWHIIGLDAGPNMLKLAQAAVDAKQLSHQISLVHDHLPCTLPEINSDDQARNSLQATVQAIVSNSLLHHLPDPMSLWTTIAEQAPAGCLIQVMDLHRPETVDQAQALVKAYAGDAPDVLANDFYNSLLAAYTADEVEAQLQDCGLGHLTVNQTSDRHWQVQGIMTAR